MSNLDFKDIALVPRVVSTVDSRDDVKVLVKFNDTYQFTNPIIASPMKDVCDGNVANEMRRCGGLGIIHRFMPIEDQVSQYITSPNSACAIGVNGDYKERFIQLYASGCIAFCLDTANGATNLVKKTIEWLSKHEVNIIVGNVASAECYEWLQSFPVVRAIRVGIASGYACTTKNATGVSRGMVSCIRECASVKKNTLLIADGGIKEPEDMCKAIACGADLVMLGSIIAATKDSPADIIVRDRKYKVYHGSASFEIQKSYRDKPRYIEGKTRLLEYNGESLESVMVRFLDGLRSSMSYFNALDLENYRKNVTFA